MNRLKTIVNWYIDKRLYFIINIHHNNASFKKNLLNMAKDITHQKRCSKIREIYIMYDHK